MNNIKSFTLYREYYDLITLLSDKEQANVSLAILKYMFDDTEIKLNDRESKNKSQNANKTKTKQNQNEIKINSNEDTHQDVNVNVNVYGNVKDIYSFIEDNFNRTLSPIEYEQISEWEDNELTRYAIKQAVLNGAYSIKYITRILESYKTKNIKTIQEAQRDEQNFKNKNGKVITTEWLNKDIESLEASDEDIRKLEERMRRVKNEN